MKLSLSHGYMRNSWRRWANRDVIVTVEPGHELGELRVDYTDGCDGSARGSRSLTLAHVEWVAMGWVSYTLELPDGTRSEHKGWLHPDFDAVSSPEADEAEAARRLAIADAIVRCDQVLLDRLERARVQIERDSGLTAGEADATRMLLDEALRERGIE